MDERTLNVSVWMLHRDLAGAPRYPLPGGYQLRAYREGVVATWVRIQQASDPFSVPTAEHFAASMPGNTAYLAERVRFLVDRDGADIGTITAWNADLDGRHLGQIHWVAILPTAQGRGLAKPLLSAACDLLRAHGYAEAWLETGTGRLPALNLYLHFGFAPYPREEADRAAWRTVAPQLKFAITV